MMGRIRLTRLILISFFSLLVIQILIVGIFGKFSALEFRQREKESVDYILSMYSRNMEGALEKIDNDLEDILLSNSTLMLLKNKSGLQRWHASYALEEIANIEDYLEMQRILYKDCFYFYMEVPEMLEKWEIPQMLLHTFMENIFKHAVSIDTFTTIFLRCSLEKFDGISVLKIEIQNSGNHFRQEILERINEDAGKKENHNRGIGLIYTKEILSIMYDREDLLFLENEEAGNVKVTVRIPGKVQMKGKGYSAE